MFSSLKFTVSVEEEAKKLGITGEGTVLSNVTVFTLDERLQFLDEVHVEFNKPETPEEAKYAPSIVNLQMYSDTTQETFDAVKKTIADKKEMSDEDKRESTVVLTTLKSHQENIGRGLNKEVTRLKAAKLFDDLSKKTIQLGNNIVELITKFQSQLGIKSGYAPLTTLKTFPSTLFNSTKPPLRPTKPGPLKKYGW